ncbi:outer membrane autotransporter barrel domain protein [Selenomonas sputigena ATCC 35185]|uniref:Outer membrane autotransporter barrel domain protein n=1 Tax=Selenomonas sputigena (strain ATCC 35185 / DSM 20758 / CCUG 44933 / VPI D19B-28) TaxID=546271 RepID=C9LTG5_SELS3|nr:outer membrane autotransporter barrel domain protein [Selenomonas sputigena ATCC 35185]
MKGKGNEVYNVGNFEKMKFVLDTTLAAGDTMLRGINAVQAFDWDKISVGDASTWGNSGAASKRVILYDGSTITLNNYGPSTSNGISADGNSEYGVTTNTGTPGAVGTSVTATQIYFDRNKFQNAKVTYDTDSSSPALPPASGLYGGAIYAGTSTLGNTTKKNTLTVDGRNINGRTLYGGYTQSTSGDSTGNEVILKDTVANSSQTYVYGGWSEKNNATGNTVTLTGAAGGSSNYYLNVYGGGGNGSGKNHVTGNLLQVKGKGNEVYNVGNFEKMKFVLDTTLAAGDTMLRGINAVQAFDWDKISVGDASTWGNSGAASKRVILYDGSTITLNNYGPSTSNGISADGNSEYGVTTNTGTPGAVGTPVTATQIYFDRNQFQNAKVTYDTDASSPTLPPAGGLYGGAIYAGTSTLGNTTRNNTLTVDGRDINGRILYGGYTQSTSGDSTGNEVILKDTVSSSTHATIYGGWSEKNNATGNTVTLTGAAGGNTNYYLSVYGGGGNGSGKNHVTGNLLQVKGKGNEVYNVGNFEKMKFVLDTTVAAGDTMLRGINAVQAFDWDKISVGDASTWGNGSVGSKRIVLYTGSTLTLDNYGTSSSNGVSGNFEYGITTNTSTPGAVGTVSASEIYFDRNQFQNAKVTYDTKPSSPALPAPSVLYGAGIYAGTSTLGNTTKNNTLTVDGRNINGRTLYGGYTQSTSGDSTGNEVILKDTVSSSGHATVYGGWSEKNNATDNTVTLTGAAGGNTNYYLSVYGGGGTGSGKDYVTGNLLQVKGKGNEVYNVRNFEKMKFVLDSNIASGDTMLRGINTTQNFDWNKIAVKGITSWAPALSAHGVNIPTLTLYTGAGFTLTNYAPTLVGTAGDYEFGKKANVTGTGTVSASVLTLDGNRFQNATETPTTSSSTDIHAGISIYGNTTNHNTLNLKKNGSTPLTFTTARAGYTKALNGGSDFNTLNLLDGASVTTGYAGYTEGRNLLLHPTDEDDPTAVDTTKNADAKNNTVNIKGGTLNAGGKLYGGYIATNAALTPPNNVSAGNASGNTINIESGTFGGSNEIYGGYTNGTGKATGNTINLGKSDGSLTSTTLQNVFLYGGAASGTTNDVFTDNLLNVNAKGLTVRNIKNFGKMKFNLGGMGTIAQTDQLLTLSGGATNGLDWAGVEVVPGSYHPFTPSTYNARLFTALHNGSGISFTKGTTDTYLPIGAKEKIVGDFEYIIDTATGSVSAQDVYVDGFRFRNHTATYNETSAHAEAWAGRTASGQTVTDNKLIVTGGTLNTAAYGGLVENKKHKTDGTFQDAGDAKKNELEVAGGTVANAYGAKVMTAAGEAEENSVKITGGTVNNAYGVDLAQATNTKNARKNKAEVANGSLSGSLYGAHTAGSGSLSESEVKVSGGTIAGSVYGSDVATGAGNATGSKITLTGGTITGDVYGGKTAGTGAATGHTLNLNGGTVGGNVYGGHAASGATTGNTVNLGDGTTNAVTTVTGTISGGSGTTDTDNVLNVNTNATAGNIANFGMVKFNFNATFNQANPMLNLVGGAVTNFDWSKFKHTGNAPSGQSVLLQNMTGINVDHYTGAKEISSTGTHEYTIDTDTNTATAKQILYGGYQFKDANTTPTTGSALADIWAGRSVIGNTTTNNTLTINGTTHRDAYGGWTAGTGTTAAAKNDSTGNTVNLKAGTVRTIYGGFTSVQTGSATGNKVTISGGAVTGAGYGKVYGGYLSYASATGSATGNTVTITGGSMTDVYGGFTNGTGVTTGNTVNLGTATNAVASGTTIGTIYGGSKPTATNNTLNVYDSVTAGNIANFDTVNFKATSSHIQTGDTLLTLNGGATSLDWKKLHVDNLDSLNASATSDTILTLMHHTANNINLANYSTTGTRGRIHSSDYEADIMTDGNSVTTQNIYLRGYRFQNNTTTYAGGTATDAWGGRSRIGNKVQNNKLTLTGGSATLVARGGLVSNTELDAHGNPKTTGDAEKNSLILNTGANTLNAYGAEVRTKSGSATENTATLNAGTVNGNLYGASLSATGATGSATKNKVELQGGSVTGSVYGSHIADGAATGSATASTVTVTGGTVSGDIYGGFTNGSGATTGNTVDLGDGTNIGAISVTGTIHGGNKADASGNTLDVKTNAQAGNIKNFESVKLTLKSSAFNPANALLRLTGGAQTTELDWSKLEVDTTALAAAPKSYEAYRVKLMENANGISFMKGATNTYASHGAKERTQGDLEYVIDTDNHTANAANSIDLEAYQFQNKQNAAFTAADGTKAEAWGGRTKVGNKVQNNKLTVSGGTLTQAAYGGLAENFKRDDHGNLKTTGDAEKNSLILNAGANTLNAYGAQVRTKSGSATENTATLNAGTVNGSLYGASLSAAGATGSATKNKVEIKGGTVTGSVYGSHIADGAATGSATASTVTVTGGTVSGDIYAGFTNGSGKTTGNTVNLGDGEHNLAAGTNIAGTVFGGNKADVTDNTLNINTNAQAGNIKNFDHLNFNLNSHALTQSTPVLRLNSGATGNLDWRKLDVNAEKFNAPIKTYEAYNLVLMENANGISFQQGATNTYTASGGVKSTTSGDFEFTIDTANHTASSTQVMAAGFKFKNHAATYNEISAHNEAWAGRTNIGNKVEKNTLTVSGGTITTAAYGGLVINNKPSATTGDAEKNAVNITGGTVANAYGAQVRTKAGSASENTAKISGGTVSHVYGASLTAAGATGSALKSRVDVTGGAVTGDVYGGQIADTGAMGSVTESQVNLTGGSVGGSVYGGRTNGSGFVKDNIVNITGGTLHDVYGGFAQAGKATGNTVNLGTATNAVAAGTSVGTIWGGNSGAAGNTLNVNSRQANAADVKNFENVNFDAAHNVSHGDTLLRLTNGANTSIDWSKMKLKNLDAVTASPTTNHILTLVDSVNDVTFTNYDAARARETKRDGDYEYVLNTDNETATAKKVEVIGYRFANNHPVYSTGANTEAWGGRTKVGNKVEKNSLKVMGGSLTTAAYGGLVQNLEAGSGAGGYKTNGDAAENTLELHAGATVVDGYGADVRAQAGNATGNTVDLKGATVTGNLYAGALTHASASGAATGNKVNLYSGTVAGDVYAGFAAGSGTTTGNTITIGDGTHDANVHVTGKLYGGNKSATDNALDIKSKGAAVGSLAGFSKIKFNLGSSVADGDTVLTLNENTTLDYSTVEKPTGGSVSAWLGNVMQKKAHLFQMAAGKTLTLNGYAPATGSERAGDVEYSLVTDNNAAATTSGSLDLSAYKWQNADVKITSAVPDAFGGKTVYGTSGETKNNKLTLKTGAAVTNAIAGDTQTANGTAEGNTLTVEAGTATNALGAKTKAGKAVKNKAVLQGGSVTNLKGAESTSGEAEENTAILQGGTAADVVGAQAAGDATENKAVIKAGAVTGSLKGAKSAAKANKNTVEIEGGNVSGTKIMGAEAKDAAEENVVTIKAATSNASTEITGAHSTHGNAAKNIVNVNAAVSGTLVGGSAGVSDATDNVLNINANVTGDVFGARAHHASLRNTVNIKDGVTVTGNVTGGACLNANENTINIGRGSTVTGNVIGGNGSVENKNNIINLKGGTVTGDIIGGAGASADNNTLAVYHDEAHTSRAHDFDKIKNLHFYLGESIANENPTLLQLGVANKDIRGVDVGVGVMGLAHGLKVNDVISLMKVNGGTLTTDADGAVPPAPATLINHVEAMHGVSLLYGFDLMKRGSGELIATVTKAAISDQAKSFVETRAGMTDFINRGADLLTTSGMSAIRKGAESNKEKGKYDLWAVMSRGSMSVESGSQIDTTGWNLSLGWAKELRKKDAAIVVSPFIEYGKGSYDSHLDDGTHGSGKLSYLGAGVLARMEKEDGLWLQGTLHAGRAKSDYTGSISAGTVSNYDSSDTYVAAELSVGKTMKLKGGDKLDASLRYLWSYQSGGDVAIKTGKYNDVYDFAAVNSHRLRLGTRYSHKESEGNELYAGLYWEYEFSGKACASFMGYEAPSPSLRGGSALLELGWRFQPKDSRVSYDLNLSGWQGKREGVTGSAHVNWAF